MAEQVFLNNVPVTREQLQAKLAELDKLEQENCKYIPGDIYQHTDQGQVYLGLDPEKVRQQLQLLGCNAGVIAVSLTNPRVVSFTLNPKSKSDKIGKLMNGGYSWHAAWEKR